MAALAATGLQSFFSALTTRREREAIEKRELREKAAETVGPALTLLRELRPEWVITRSGGPAREEMREWILGTMWPRWETLQDRLATLAASHPDDRVGDKANEVMGAARSLIGQLRWAIDEKTLSTEQWKDIKKMHDDAIKLALDLLAVIRQSEPNSAPEEPATENV